MNWHSVIHALHILMAGLWAGGLVFTAAVVSPAFKRMEWTPAERIAVRSAVGRQYTKVARLNLAALLVTALADWLPAGLGGLALAEITLIAAIVLLSELHARYYAPRLARAAAGGAVAGGAVAAAPTAAAITTASTSAAANPAARPPSLDRARLLRVSIGVSMLNLALSTAVVILSSLRPL